MIKRTLIEETKEGLLVRIKAQPGASKSELLELEDGLKLRIMAPAVDNKANKAVIEFFSKSLRTAKSNISIVKGELSREKTILIKNVDEKTFKDKFSL